MNLPGTLTDINGESYVKIIESKDLGNGLGECARYKRINDDGREYFPDLAFCDGLVATPTMIAFGK